jgi:hypothetical protein
VYLGTLITTYNNTSAKINNRIALAIRSYFGLVNILKVKNIKREYRVSIYTTLIKPVLLYGAETWVLSKADELHLGVFERKILRRIYGTLCEGAIWRSRYNEELYRLYEETDLVTTIRITRFRWAGHIVQMQDNLRVPCKKISLDKPEGRRRVGRPNLRWLGVTKNAERLGVRNWRSKAKDRDGWRRLLESAKTLHGLLHLGVSE